MFDDMMEYIRELEDDKETHLKAMEEQRKALSDLLEMYVDMVNSGDCGNWDTEKEKEVIAARKALKDKDKE